MGGWDLSSVAGLYLCQNVCLGEERRDGKTSEIVFVRLVKGESRVGE